jgi:DNA polymerase III alpha subunit
MPSASTRKVRVTENLIRAGALDGLGGARRELLWELGGLAYPEEGWT